MFAEFVYNVQSAEIYKTKPTFCYQDTKTMANQ